MKISFCTTCMDRLFHLRQTYLRNLQNSSSYPDAEFILLDYGSADGLWEWVRENLGEYLESGRVKYYRTETPRFWVASHAKNVAHRLASGEILCNLDSDILIPQGFCEYISSAFLSKPDIVIAFDSDDPYGNHGCAGMVIVRRDHFYSVNGYDESIRLGWSCEDMNLQFRCRMHNSLELLVPPKMCLCIPHSNDVRTAKCSDRDIEKTRDISVDVCKRAAEEKEYVANKGSIWGSATVFKNFSKEPIEAWASNHPPLQRSEDLPA